MSTKITISHDEDIHFYQEVADESKIYLRVRKGGVDLKLEIDVCHALAIAKAFDLGRVEAMSKLTDEEIAEHVRACVKARLGKTGLGAIFGMLVYGAADEPEETQVESGLKYYKMMRDNVKECVARATQGGRTPFTFGLEELLTKSASKP